MNDLAKQEFNSIFKDVRKAYRLLYLYQRRVLDLVKFIGDNLSLSYNGGWSWFTNPAPKNGKGNLDLWAWDWINMYHYEFHFGGAKVDGNTTLFSVFLVTDTGFFDAGNNDKRDIGSFSSVDASSTKLVFLAGKNLWHSSFKDFSINFKKNAVEYSRQNDSGVILAKSFEMDRFTNQNSTIKCLEELLAFYKEQGIDEFSLVQS